VHNLEKKVPEKSDSGAILQLWDGIEQRTGAPSVYHALTCSRSRRKSMVKAWRTRAVQAAYKTLAECINSVLKQDEEGTIKQICF
jgi:hypothetical protein